MGFQFIVKVSNQKKIEETLGLDFTVRCEVFPVTSEYIGISIPTKVLDEHGESTIMGKLALLEHFDLWAGCWRKPKSKWKIW